MPSAGTIFSRAFYERASVMRAVDICSAAAPAEEDSTAEDDSVASGQLEVVSSV